MSNNLHKKIGKIDEFARKFYCQRAKVNKVRSDKKIAKKKVRNYLKNECIY